MKIIIFLFLFIIPVTVYSAFEKIETGARPLALANTLVAVDGSPYAIYYNPSGISDKSFLAVSYRNYYNITEISQINLVANTKIFNYPLAFGVSRYGNSLYSEIQISIGGSYTITDNLKTGLVIDYYSLSINKYGSDYTVGIDFGLLYNLLPNLDAGLFVTNINHPAIGQANEDLPQTISLGVQYKIDQSFSLTFDFYRDTHYSQNYRAGFRYEVFNNAELRFGIDDGANQYSLGAGTNILNIQFDYAMLIHQVLGISHAISVRIDL